MSNLERKPLIEHVYSLWLVEVPRLSIYTTERASHRTHKNLHLWFSCFVCCKLDIVIAQQIWVLHFFIALTPRSPKENPEDIKMTAEWWRCCTAPIQHERIAVFWSHKSHGHLFFRAVHRKAFLLKHLQALPYCALGFFKREYLLPKAFHHKFSYLVEDLEDLSS